MPDDIADLRRELERVRADAAFALAISTLLASAAVDPLLRADFREALRTAVRKRLAGLEDGPYAARLLAHLKTIDEMPG